MGTPALVFPTQLRQSKYHTDQKGLQPRDLVPFIGSRNRVHEVLKPPAIADPQYDSAITRGTWNSGGVSNQRWAKTGSLIRAAEKSIRNFRSGRRRVHRREQRRSWVRL